MTKKELAKAFVEKFYGCDASSVGGDACCSGDGSHASLNCSSECSGSCSSTNG